jgi:hypothetical protein
MSVLIAVLVTSVAAMAAVRVSVTPLEGTAKTKFTVSFVVTRKVSGDSWLTVAVLSPIRQNDCENAESAAVTYAPKGRRVTVVLRPVDKLRWCPGVYRGDIHVEHRIGCGGAGLDEGPCSTNGATIARFSFTVTP